MYIYIFAEATYPKNVKNMTIVVGTKNFQLIEWIYEISKESQYFEKNAIFVSRDKSSRKLAAKTNTKFILDRRTDKVIYGATRFLKQPFL